MRHDLRRPECDETTARLWEYLDAELAPGVAASITRHFQVCDRCRALMVASRRLLAAVRASGRRVRAPATLRSRIIRLKAAAG